MKSESLEGKILGGWKIEQAIGEGGQGSLYFVRKPGIDGNPIRGAMKTLSLSKDVDPQEMARIVHELEMLKSADSPYLPRVLDSGSGGVPVDGKFLVVQFIVMEFVNGDNLDEEIRESGVLSPYDWWNLAHDLLMAISVLHEKGIVHADVKPHNVMRGARKTVLVDLGGSSLVGLADPGDAGLMTMGWAAPEQYRRDVVRADDWGYEVDVFCAGQLLVFAATGSQPWGEFTSPRFPVGANHGNFQQMVFEAGIRYADRIKNHAPNYTGMTREQISLVGQMLHYAPENRATASALLDQVRENLPKSSERKNGDTPQPMRWTPQTNGSDPGFRPSTHPLSGEEKGQVGNWGLSILLVFLFPGSILRYLYLDARETWRDKRQRGEFRLVAIAAGITSLGVMIPVILRRWWRAEAGDLYKMLSLVAWVVPAIGVSVMFFVLSTGYSATGEINGGTAAFIFLWEVLLFGGSIFAALIPVSALEAPAEARRAKMAKKRRFA